MLSTLAYVGLGGAVGAMARFLIGIWVLFPYGTMAVNVTGSFVIGAIYVWLNARGAMYLHPFLAVGFLGGFTTFSTFSFDVIRLVESGRVVMAGVYVLLTVSASLIACFAGYEAMKGLVQ